jgi:penicillin amidase
MRFLKIVGWSLLALLGILALISGIFVYTHKPDYSGEKVLRNNKEEVKVYFDTYGIPHIYAQNEADAFRALGYVHAQDRLWQMELLRRIAPGRLSEVFGEVATQNDRFFLALGIDDASVAIVDALDPNSASVHLSSAYLEGINQFIEDGSTPVEFYLTGIEKQAFELKDIYNIMGYMAFNFAMGHKTDPLLTQIYDQLGPDYLMDLEINVDPNTVWIKNYNPSAIDTLANTMTASVMQTLKDLSIPLFEGSNSWVIAPEKTKNGKVIFANDPHIGFSQPSVWYEAHLITPTYEKYGYHLGGVPFALLGHNTKLAYGMTMFENDDVDFYYEEPHPKDSTLYRWNDTWVPYQYVTKTIKVKDAEDINFTFRKTKNGPVLNGIADQITSNRPISMWWIYTHHENKVMDALYDLSHAGDLKEFQNALPKIHGPGLNIMYGDAEGNVAWWATATLYKIPDSVNTKFVQNANSGLSPNKDYLDFTQNPQAINPPWHYVYSANNQPDSIAGMLYPGYYLPEDRAKRIVSLLDAKNDWDREAVGKMINDVTSPVNPSVAKDLAKAIDVKQLTDEEAKLLDRLTTWQGDYPLNSVEATIFSGWVYHYLENTFKDELGEELFAQFMNTHFLKRLIAPMAHNPGSVWWDDVSTPEKKETEQDMVLSAFQQTLNDLETAFGPDPENWTWNKVHTLEHGHPIGQVKALRSFFNVGPFPVIGSREVINNMNFGYDGSLEYKVGSGPSTRRVIDFSDVKNSMSILPTGQSGNPFSKHYEDQAEMYVQGKFRKMMLDQKEIAETAESVLTFKSTKD